MNNPNETNDETEGSLNPWTTIFFRPGATASWLVRHETAESARMLWLAFTALTVIFLFVAATFWPLPISRSVARMRLAVATPFIFAFSYLYFVVNSHILMRICNRMGGWTTTVAMRVVSAYTTVVPGLLFGVVKMGLSLLLGPDAEATSVVESIGLVWTIYITACGIAAAAGLPKWRGLLIYLLTGLMWVGPVGLALMAVIWIFPLLF